MTFKSFELKYFYPIVLLVLLANCKQENGSYIHYTISQTINDSVPLLKVQMQLEGDSSGSTKFVYSDKAWGQEDLFNALAEVRLVSPKGGVVEINKDSSWILVNHNGKRGPLVLEYLLTQDFSLEEQPQQAYRPIIQPEYFHLFSHNFFIVPETWENNPQSIRQLELSWEGFPKDYVIHNSFGSRNRVQQLNDISLENFHTAIFVGGDFRIQEGDIQGNRVVLAARGDWIPFNEPEVFKVLMQTLEAQRNFWQDHSQEYFTVTLRPMLLERGSAFQGTGLTNSFACSISNNENTDIEQLVYLFNHELQHNWTGHTIQNDNEEEQYWFSEGFTEYYTFKNISKYKIGGVDDSFFIEQLNETIRNLYSSPVVAAANSEINYENFWANPDYGKLPYYRGAVFAFFLDNWILQNSGGEKRLDQLMLELLRDAREEGQKIEHTYWIEKLEQYLGSQGAGFFEEHIVEGEPFQITRLLQNFGFEFAPTTIAFDKGFEFAEDNRTVVSVNEKSNAYEAGLRVGDHFKTYSIEFGNISKPIKGVYTRGKKETAIEYMPVKEMPIPKILITDSNLEKIRKL